MRKLLFILLAVFFASSCNDNTPGNGQVFIPDVPVSITVNLDLPSHFHLQNLGSFSLLEGGHRGIFLVHNFDDEFYALERTCTFNTDLSCSHIQVDSSNIQLRCGTYDNDTFAECCQSLYSFDGFVLQGPSRFALKRYQVFRNGSLLTIRN
ncbi:MAG: hypothetical protein JJ975_02270 [Bacteroidia bacterium]|nr:hypothetical protein [Bacteroidia bacterium]